MPEGSRKHILFIFLDGIGVGADDPESNPFVRAPAPCLKELLEGKYLTISDSYADGIRFSLRALDACLGVKGMPQSATGQAALLTGVNIPEKLGYHYGPKPNSEVANYLVENNLLKQLQHNNKTCFFLNAYPQRYFDSIASGRRLYSSIPLACTSAGLALRTKHDLVEGKAISADLTGEGWHHNLGIDGIPILTPFDAGRKLVELSRMSDFALFEYWLSDYAGHSQDMARACQVIMELDGMLCGILSEWHEDEGLVLITSDHGNLEDLSTNRHTVNPVPALVIGEINHREGFMNHLDAITDITPAILNFLG